MKIVNDFTLKIGGPAGYGIKVTGALFSKACSRGGLHIFSSLEYPSLIRGGHNTYTCRVSVKQVGMYGQEIDLLLALDQPTVDMHYKELSKNGMLVYDNDVVDLKECPRKDIHCVGIPLTALAREVGGAEVMRNTVALGAIIALLKYEFPILERVLTDEFSRKGEEIVSANIKAARAGADKIRNDQLDKDFPGDLDVVESEKQMIISGNEAVALGAIAAGCQCYIAYPMTPATSILHYLKANEKGTRMLVIQPEDEISVINMALGASFAGARSMIGTSGGGFALMTEGLGLAGITETPLVIIESQRPGPATGLPTWTEQGDLQFLRHAAQGEFPRIIIAPGDPAEAFTATGQALNLAEEYQLPVFILLDKHLSESFWSQPLFDTKSMTMKRGKLLSHEQLAKIKDYQRYEITDDGISSRAIPGQEGGIHVANSDEHDTYGYSTEDSATRVEQADKRARKLEVASKSLPQPKIYGPIEARITLIGWGSTKGAMLEAQRLLSENDISVNVLHLQYVWPLPIERLKTIISASSKTLLIENNSEGQLGMLIHEQAKQTFDDRLLKYDGRPFFPEEIVKKVKDII